MYSETNLRKARAARARLELELTEQAFAASIEIPG
jgi:hypothetical protein